MATIYHDTDTDLTLLSGKTVAIIGYGNQGRAQALNLRDSGVSVMIGCPPDTYREAALRDGQVALDIAGAAAKSDIILFLIPDEIQAEVYRVSIEPHLRRGMMLGFASGYNIRFGYIVPRTDIDVVL